MGLLPSRDGTILYAADHTNCRIRAVTFATAGSKVGTVTTVVGDGSALFRDGVGVTVVSAEKDDLDCR